MIMSHSRPARALTILCGALLLGLFGNVAFAEATVTVQVRNQNGSPADGTVVLTGASGGSASFSCQTHAGTCQNRRGAGRDAYRDLSAFIRPGSRSAYRHDRAKWQRFIDRLERSLISTY
jgi:hypothetical protein